VACPCSGRHFPRDDWGTAEVSGHIAGVSEAAAKTGVAAGEVLDAAKVLALLSDNLRSDVDHFTTGCGRLSIFAGCEICSNGSSRLVRLNEIRRSKERLAILTATNNERRDSAGVDILAPGFSHSLPGLPQFCRVAGFNAKFPASAPKQRSRTIPVRTRFYSNGSAVRNRNCVISSSAGQFRRN
jgi:hypothetical protein